MLERNPSIKAYEIHKIKNLELIYFKHTFVYNLYSILMQNGENRLDSEKSNKTGFAISFLIFFLPFF